MAGLVGYGVRALRKRFAELCKEISRRYLDYRKKFREERRSAFVDEIVSAAFHLHSLRQPITKARIADHLNKPSYRDNPRLYRPIQEAKRRLGIL